MNLLNLIAIFGYPVIVIGTCIEGEMVLALGGFAAHRGYLHLWLVIASAFCGAVAGDQLFFYLGRYKSRTFLERHPGWRSRISTVERRIDRYRMTFVLGFRFVYGLRTVSPFVLGMSDIPYALFAVLDATSALAWAILVGLLGYFFGNAMEVVLGDIEHYEMELFGVIVIVGLIIWLIRMYRSHRTAPPAP